MTVKVHYRLKLSLLFLTNTLAYFFVQGTDKIFVRFAKVKVDPYSGKFKS
jgi:hypothetical protein